MFKKHEDYYNDNGVRLPNIVKEENRYQFLQPSSGKNWNWKIIIIFKDHLKYPKMCKLAGV